MEFEASSEFGVSEIEIFIDNKAKLLKVQVRHYFRFHWIFLNLSKSGNARTFCGSS